MSNQSLRNLRKEAGFKSAKQFAEYIGLQDKTYARYEWLQDRTGLLGSIPTENLIKIADGLKCSVDAILGRTTDTFCLGNLSEQSQQELKEFVKYLRFKDLMDNEEDNDA